METTVIFIFMRSIAWNLKLLVCAIPVSVVYISALRFCLFFAMLYKKKKRMYVAFITAFITVYLA